MEMQTTRMALQVVMRMSPAMAGAVAVTAAGLVAPMRLATVFLVEVAALVVLTAQRAAQTLSMVCLSMVVVAERAQRLVALREMEFSPEAAAVALKTETLGSVVLVSAV